VGVLYSVGSERYFIENESFLIATGKYFVGVLSDPGYWIAAVFVD
jgi:hypothetical protein